MKFMGQICNDSQPLIEYHQRIAGYFLTADTREKCVFCFHGLGNNASGDT